jgi:hypothetical protein
MALFFLWTAIAMRASKGLFSVDCDCDEGFERASFLWIAIAMRAATLLHSDLLYYYTTD